MQVLRHLFQVGGDMNGVTWDGVDAGYNDGNTYVLERPEGLILFDCGCGDTLHQIEANMQYWGLELKDVAYCILTHAHFDHAGAGHLLKAHGIEFIAVGETAEAVAAGDDRCCGYLYHKTFTPFEVDQVVADGESFELFGVNFRVMHLPGHSRGCTAFFFEHEGRQLVVSGDVIGTLLAGDFGWSGSIDFDKVAYLDSLKRFAQVDTDIMLPGHGMIYFHQPRRRVQQALNTALMEWR
ncbi:MAG: MBL fold metallo-hydrolase [Planctomycetales bacterium]|nr:MBL fold metallo-hydrolase [Planctomycetales bacterium]